MKAKLLIVCLALMLAAFTAVPAFAQLAAPNAAGVLIGQDIAAMALACIQAGEEILLAQSKYVPQKGPQSSPLTMGGRPPGSSSGGGGGSRRN